MSRFDNFVAIDFETTGLDPKVCEIIELGAVRYENGAIAEQYSKLIKPVSTIPPEITALTGIDDFMVEDSPSIDEALDEFLKIIDKSPWLVGHNVAFDLGFLKPHITKQKALKYEARTLDTGVLARILYPRLPRYSLRSLADYFVIKRKRAHRSLDDALATSAIYLKLMGYLASLPIPSKDTVGRLLLGSEYIKDFHQSLEGIAPLNIEEKSLLINADEKIDTIESIDDLYPDNIIGESPPEKFEDYIPVDLAAVENHFLPGGILSRSIAPYEYRPQQKDMAVNVAAAFNRSEFLLAEAPTGVGKSIAYLLPASWWASQNREHVIISTQTKSLQSQLFYKDIPQIQKAVGYQFRAALLKGRGNYICLYKFHELLIEAEASFGKQDREALASLTLWVNKTKTGDISECNGFNPAGNYYLWSRISCEGSFCLGQGCQYAEKCFLLRIKKEAQTAQITVANHYLTFADFASGGEMVINSGNIIFDEAHNLEKVAASYLGNSFDRRNLDGLLSDMYSSRPTQTGFLINLKSAILFHGAGNLDLVADTDSVIDSITTVGHTAGRFFEKLSETIKTSFPNSESREIPYTSENNLCGMPERDEFIGDLARLLERLEKLLESLGDSNDIPKKHELITRLGAFVSDIKTFHATANDLLFAENNEYVYWIEKPSSPRHSPRILSAPLEVGKLLDKKFYDHLKTAIFTSATLTVNKNFDYIRHRLGLDLASKERVLSISLDSPFDIDSEVAVISAGYLPSPKEKSFEEIAIESLGKILCSKAKKSMVLFTSYRSLKNASEKLREELNENGIELFSQDGSYNSQRILSRFKAAKRAALFGTDTFWEGVDLPGELLELLVLFKLPFTVPDRPWFKANLDKIEREGGSAFAMLSLPEAVVKFRQGFGRLIRTANDRGCVVALDSRLEKSSFGRIFLNSIGGKKIKCGNAGEIVNIIDSWLDGKSNKVEKDKS